MFSSMGYLTFCWHRDHSRKCNYGGWSSRDQEESGTGVQFYFVFTSPKGDNLIIPTASMEYQRHNAVGVLRTFFTDFFSAGLFMKILVTMWTVHHPKFPTVKNLKYFYSWFAADDCLGAETSHGEAPTQLWAAEFQLLSNQALAAEKKIFI